MKQRQNIVFSFRTSSGRIRWAATASLFRNAETGPVCLWGCGEFCKCIYPPAGMRAGQSHASDRTVPDTDRLLPQCGFPAPEPEDSGKVSAGAGYRVAFTSENGIWLPMKRRTIMRCDCGSGRERGGYDDYWMAADVLEFTSHGYGGYIFDKDGISWILPATDRLFD